MSSLKEKFSTTSYFFVSAQVARAFPEAIESRLVLAHKSFYLSDEQMLRINPLCTISLVDKGDRDNIADNSLASWMMSLLQSLSLCLTNLALIFGSQNYHTQKLLIGFMNPNIVVVMGLLGTVASTFPIGLAFGTVFLLACGGAIYLMGRWYQHGSALLERLDQLSQPTHNKKELQTRGVAAVLDLSTLPTPTAPESVLFLAPKLVLSVRISPLRPLSPPGAFEFEFEFDRFDDNDDDNDPCKGVKSKARGENSQNIDGYADANDFPGDGIFSSDENDETNDDISFVDDDSVAAPEQPLTWEGFQGLEPNFDEDEPINSNQGSKVQEMEERMSAPASDQSSSDLENIRLRVQSTSFHLIFSPILQPEDERTKNIQFDSDVEFDDEDAEPTR